MKTGPDLQETSNVALDGDLSASWRRYLRQNLQQRALTGSVLAYDAENLLLLDFKAHIIESPKLLTDSSCATFIPHRKGQIRLAAGSGPPARQILLKRLPSNEAEAVRFTYMMDSDRDPHPAKPCP